MARHIAIYGKGGSGKTTIATNLAAALAETGARVLFVGCSSTADSSRLLGGETVLPPFFTGLAHGARPEAGTVITPGYRGIGCIEVGEYLGEDCCPAGNVVAALKLLKELAVVETYGADFVIYDLPGDVGCVSEALLAEADNDFSLLVTSADFRSLYAANRLIGLLSRSQHPGCIALVANGSVSSFEDSLLADFAGRIGVRLAAAIPRSFAVRQSELYGKTVIEYGPLSTHAYSYRKLARLVSGGERVAVGPKKIEPLDAAGLKGWAYEWGKRLGELEFGIIQDGAGI